VELQPEWNEFLGLLASHRVRYLLIGGLAVGAHGRPRYTVDLDVFVEPTVANARRLARVLADFGFRSTARAWRKLSRPGKVLSLGNEPIAIDILTSIPGVAFAGAWKRRVVVATEMGNLFVLGLDDLRASKLAAGRTKDMLDLALLDELSLATTRAAGRSRSKRRRRVAPRSRTPGKAGARKPRRKTRSRT
jgi:hypothetical protein